MTKCLSQVFPCRYHHSLQSSMSSKCTSRSQNAISINASQLSVFLGRMQFSSLAHIASFFFLFISLPVHFCAREATSLSKCLLSLVWSKIVVWAHILPVEKVHLLTVCFLLRDFAYAWLDNCNSFLPLLLLSSLSLLAVAGWGMFSELFWFFTVEKIFLSSGSCFNCSSSVVRVSVYICSRAES